MSHDWATDDNPDTLSKQRGSDYVRAGLRPKEWRHGATL